MIALVAALLIAQPDGVGLPLEELAAYRDALRDEARSPVPNVAFSDLWKRPEAYRSRRVGVTGVVVREFRAPASGELPARVELWIELEGQNLICAVFPDRANPKPFVGRVAIRGTSLGHVRYRSGDAIRLAPLIVGPEAPRESAGSNPRESHPSWDGTAWTVAAVAAIVVTGFLARAFARRPARPREMPGPGVEFES